MKTLPFEYYLVGGAVRDQLLGRKVSERDWVVVGSTPEEMKKLSFKQVGKNFPVFLHPDSGEEYALARTERKQGHGYHGFSVDFSPEVTLEEDLSRRDLTVNAMALDSNGGLVDPFDGKRDLESKLLRHVSPAFAEDPLRVLRVARFVARYHDLGFTISPDTEQLMTDIVRSGELEYLTPERVWQDTDKALSENSPWIFFEVLREVGALKVLFPEVDRLFGVPQTERYHPEIDTGVHVMMALQIAIRMTDDCALRFAVLTHDLGKGTTPEEMLPKHIGHEERGVPLIQELCKRLGVPNRYRDIAVLVSKHHLNCHRARELRGKSIYKMFSELDLWRRPERLEQFLICCEADARGRLGLFESTYHSADYLRSAHKAVSSINTETLKSTHSGKALGDAIEKTRIEALEEHRKNYG